MKRQKPSDIERFVRGTLGCRCPDEVFRDTSVETRSSPAGAVRYSRISVGGKLLVYVLDVAGGEPSDDDVAELARLGVAERDGGGFNRFRLAVAAADVKGLEGTLRDAFERAAGADGKAHAHVVPADALPGALMPAQTGRKSNR